MKMYVIASDSASTLTSWFFTETTADLDTPRKIHRSAYSIPPPSRKIRAREGVARASTGAVAGHHRIATSIAAVDAPGSTALPPAGLAAIGRSLKPAIFTFGEIDPLGAPSWRPQTHSAVQPKSLHGVFSPWLRLLHAHLESLGLARS